MNKHEQFSDKLFEKYNSQLGRQLEEYLEYGIYNQIFDQLYRQLTNQFHWECGGQTGVQLYHTLRDDNL